MRVWSPEARLLRLESGSQRPEYTLHTAYPFGMCCTTALGRCCIFRCQAYSLVCCSGKLHTRCYTQYNLVQSRYSASTARHVTTQHCTTQYIARLLYSTASCKIVEYVTARCRMVIIFACRLLKHIVVLPRVAQCVV